MATAFTGQAHREILLRARAIENQCFVVAAAQHGDSGPATRCFGHSMVIDPWATVLACLPRSDGVITVDLDQAYLDKVPRDLPSLRNRRPDIYALSSDPRGVV
jgi:predicted amidohydrolase